MHVYFGFKGASSTVAAFDFRIKYVVKLVKNCAKLNGDIDAQAVFRIEANWAGTSLFFLRLLLSLRGIKKESLVVEQRLLGWRRGWLDKVIRCVWILWEVWIPILQAKLDTIPGEEQRRDILAERALRVSVRGSLSAGRSSGSASSRNSPRQMVVEVRGAQRTTARRTVLWSGLVSLDWYWYKVSLIIIARNASLTGISLDPMNGVPTRILKSRLSTSIPSKYYWFTWFP